MGYCEKEPVLEKEDVCVREMSTGEVLKEITKELAEVTATLMRIKYSLDGEAPNDRNMDEPKCMHDEVNMISCMAMDCIGLSHAIYDKLFRNVER